MHHFAGTVNHAHTAHAYTVNEAKSHTRSAHSDTDTTSEQSASHAPNVAILDKLIAVFASKSPTEWRKLIAHSKQWPELSGSVLARCTAATVHCTYAFSRATASAQVAVRLLSGMLHEHVVQAVAYGYYTDSFMSLVYTMMRFSTCRLDEQRQAEQDLEKKASLRKLQRQLESVSLHIACFASRPATVAHVEAMLPSRCMLSCKSMERPWSCSRMLKLQTGKAW